MDIQPYTGFTSNSGSVQQPMLIAIEHLSDVGVKQQKEQALAMMKELLHKKLDEVAPEDKLQIINTAKRATKLIQDEKNTGRPVDSSIPVDCDRNYFRKLTRDPQTKLAMQTMCHHTRKYFYQTYAGTAKLFMAEIEKIREDMALKTAYQNTIHYHGTSETSKTAVQAAGFNVAQKKPGATQAAQFNPNGSLAMAAQKHNYLTHHKPMAQKYAVTTAPNNPALIRVIIKPGSLGLEHDPDMGSQAPFNALRTKQTIPPGYILQSKKNGTLDRSSGAVEVYRNELKNVGVKVGKQQAAKLLLDQQSDSDNDDFSKSNPFNVFGY